MGILRWMAGHETSSRPYHHGNLRAEMLAAAVEAIPRLGAAGVSLRHLARSVGVTHGAAAHHFGDKVGLFTALAAEGYQQLAAELEAGWKERHDLADVAVAYVRFAAGHPAHFAVMFRPELYRAADAQVVEARSRSSAVLYEAARDVADAAGGDPVRAGVAAWAYVHGIATLWKDGNIPPGLADDAVALTAEIGPYLFQASRAAARRGRSSPSPHRPDIGRPAPPRNPVAS